MKKILTILLCGALILGVTTGCTEQTGDDKTKTDVQEKSKGKCEVKECMSLLNTDMKLEEVNEVIGFEGEKDEATGKYTWQLTSKTKIEIEYKDETGSIKATYNKEELKNDKLKLSICYEISNNIKKTNYTYEEMVEKLEGIEGNLESYTPTSKMYSWVDADGNTFRATFSKSNKWKASIVSINP
ncbi:MAG: hypothetical protein K2G03_04850, partial [Bacilli bacterium]|nr:hypothetical protein [Bacilli bacterium]